MSEPKTFTSLLETILQLQASAAASRHGSARRSVEVTDDDESVAIAFVPAEPRSLHVTNLNQPKKEMLP